VSFTVDKFQTYRTTVEVTVGNISTIDAQLTVGQSSAVIEVVEKGDAGQHAKPGTFATS